ncbi:isoprenyl transferase [Balneolaceae bacterium ANBcel3]|nr:isoprenyl transferase [Balneolaceae bacterium ANBcel3]
MSTEEREQQRYLQDRGEIPTHIAVIMDGNGRWAKSRGNPRIFGHKAGVDSVRDITEACAEVGVRHLTLYAFSTENWGRPKGEVSALMKLLVQSLRSETNKLHENNIRLSTIGDIYRLPPSCRKELEYAIERTSENSRMELCLALSYSGRWDIRQAVKMLAEKTQKGEIAPDEIDDEVISHHLSTSALPDPDLIIRTSGEFRMSNFLLWQAAYSELYITETFWPDFRRKELYHAIESYQDRDRRFGKVAVSKAQKEPTII